MGDSAEHCAAIGRPFNEIERSTPQPIDVMVSFRDAHDVALVELLGSRVVPQIHKIDARTPLPGA